MSPVTDAERAALPAPPARLPGRAGRPESARTGGDTAPLDLAPPPDQTRRRRRSLIGELWRWWTTGVIFAVLAPLLLGFSLVAAIYWQARSDQTRPVDAIVVLGTAQYNGRPGRVLESRLERALAAYDAGTAPVVVVTGGRAPGDAFTEAEAARDYLLERGVPESALLMENVGRNTWTSMQGVANLLRERGVGRVLLVSDGFHLFRVKLMARDLGLVPFGSPAPDSPIRRGGAGEFSYVLREAAAVVVHLWRTR